MRYRPTDGHSQLKRCFVAPKTTWFPNNENPQLIFPWLQRAVNLIQSNNILTNTPIKNKADQHKSRACNSIIYFFLVMEYFFWAPYTYLHKVLPKHFSPRNFFIPVSWSLSHSQKYLSPFKSPGIRLMEWHTPWPQSTPVLVGSLDNWLSW